MFSLHPIGSTLPQNSEVHVRLRWQRRLLGLPILTPQVVIAPRRPRR